MGVDIQTLVVSLTLDAEAVAGVLSLEETLDLTEVFLAPFWRAEAVEDAGSGLTNLNKALEG